MLKESSHNTNIVLELTNELKIRREKLKNLRNYGIAFPNNFRRDMTSKQLHVIYDEKSDNELENLNILVSVAGRMMHKRIMGKALFIILQDVDGRIQLYVTCNKLVENIYNTQIKKWDLGDILGARGKVFKTKTGELSIYCTELYLLTKSLRPLPDKFHGLTDQETCYRQRYLDLIMNEHSRNVFKIRSKIINNIRNFMIKHNFIEVETPMMQMIPGGASARPFITHHNAFNMNMYLRIAPELYLKRLVIGGLERVFEINRNFRNEGISPYHNPEFTMMELYMAYADYEDLLALCENLLQFLAKDLLGTTEIPYGKEVISFTKPFQKFTMIEAITKYLPKINCSDLKDFNKTKSIAKSLHIKIEENWKIGRLISEIFEEIVVIHLIQPTFIIEYPTEISPLARCNDKNPEITDRFELFINGHEIGNGFSELNDSDEQMERFKNQINDKAAGDDSAIFYDEDYITALEYGLPPTAGLGIGIDRLVMLFTNSHNIRDVILFPTLRPDNK
ncbi:lysine--tRNA ligase [Pantoea sp. Mhis]|uniref:lysine--tRNA ligase n=1 Tax=Pantoea sp. Mhis TaxID=2576759 RepID=UPI00135ABEC6|nr:lysine--tRNA ligase [Pantoea sp. Mhis]MXP56675.1 lysine--tRNA ligase [Pantoea sp. Mhis]